MIKFELKVGYRCFLCNFCLYISVLNVFYTIFERHNRMGKKLQEKALGDSFDLSLKRFTSKGALLLQLQLFKPRLSKLLSFWGFEEVRFEIEGTEL